MGQSALILRITALLMLVAASGTDAKMEIICRKSDLLVGVDHLLICKAGGEGNITWRKDGEDISYKENVSKMDKSWSKLSIKKAQMEDAGKYTCLCDFESGHMDQTDAYVYVYEGPSFGATKVYHEFLQGQEGVVPCIVSGQPTVDVLWFRDQLEIPSHERKRLRQTPDNSLHIRDIKREDVGTYTCQARIRGRPIIKRLSVSVVVNALPTVHLRQKVKEVMAGPKTNVSLICLVDGLPHPNISWTMPVTFDPKHHQFNSDRSKLTIWSVARADHGEYNCTAANKIGESSDTFMLHVSEAPRVSVSTEEQSVSVGESVSVSCNVSGHPQPRLYWIDTHNGQILDSTSGRVNVQDGVLTISDVVPSDGGLFSCMAVSPSGNASRGVELHTQPGPPLDVSVSFGPTSVLFSLKTLPIDGGTPITSFVLQWRRSPKDTWEEVITPSSVPLAITSLKPYTSYMVRLAAMNAVGLGHFSDTHNMRTHGIRVPDSPVLSSSQMRVERNSFSLPLAQLDDGGSPLLNFTVRYRQDKEGAEWKEMPLAPDSASVALSDLTFGVDYQLEVVAFNANGSSSPARFNFTIAQQPVTRGGITKGAVVGMVMVIFLVLLIVVDATCWYSNHCGLLMFIAVKLFGSKVPSFKMEDEGNKTTNGEARMKGVDTLRGSVQDQQQQAAVQSRKKEAGLKPEVTCDKAPLNKS